MQLKSWGHDEAGLGCHGCHGCLCNVSWSQLKVCRSSASSVQVTCWFQVRKPRATKNKKVYRLGVGFWWFLLASLSKFPVKIQSFWVILSSSFSEESRKVGITQNLIFLRSMPGRPSRKRSRRRPVAVIRWWWKPPEIWGNTHDLHRIWGSCVSPRPSERPWPWNICSYHGIRNATLNRSKQIKTSWLMAYCSYPQFS